jgi:hypothetical protein
MKHDVGAQRGEPRERSSPQIVRIAIDLVG